MNQEKIILPGGAGLVGQNLVVRLKERGYTNLVVLDKHRANLAVLQQLHPDIVIEYADLAEPGNWQRHFNQARAVVMLQAQIGGNDYVDFERNNLNSTALILDAIKAGQVEQLIHISSSVVQSVADDYYTQTKKLQEQMVLDSGIACPVLRPTLMFGWFDRKHLGWLSRFMKKVPVFPIPGNGRYLRQPLYVGDFCNVIISCLENKMLRLTKIVIKLQIFSKERLQELTSECNFGGNKHNIFVSLIINLTKGTVMKRSSLTKRQGRPILLNC